MPSPETNIKLAGTFARVAIATFLWLALLVILAVVVPAQRKTFDEYGLKLPYLTQVAIDVGMWFADFWWVIIPCSLPVLVFVALATWYFCYADNPRWLRTAWMLLIAGMPLVLTLIVVISLIIPQMKLAQGMAK
jgi:type II secretory pathway component PulF